MAGLAAGVYALLKLLGKAPAGFKDFSDSAQGLVNSVGGIAGGSPGGFGGSAAGGAAFDRPQYAPAGATQIHTGDVINAGRYGGRVAGGIVNLGDRVHVGDIAGPSPTTGPLTTGAPAPFDAGMAFIAHLNDPAVRYQAALALADAREGIGTAPFRPELIPGLYDRGSQPQFDAEGYRIEANAGPAVPVAVPRTLTGGPPPASQIINYNDITINSTAGGDEIIAGVDLYLQQQVTENDLR